MKKRCTNSDCRRVFNSSFGECPYCKKQYPQLKKMQKPVSPAKTSEQEWQVILTGCRREVLMSFPKVVAAEMNQFEHTAYRIMGRIQAGRHRQIASFSSREDALKLIHTLEAAGGSLLLIHKGKPTSYHHAPFSAARPVSIKNPDVPDQPLEDLHLSVRAYNCLKRAQIHTLHNLLDLTYFELITIRNLGKKCCDEILALLKEKGLYLKN